MTQISSMKKHPDKKMCSLSWLKSIHMVRVMLSRNIRSYASVQRSLSHHGKRTKSWQAYVWWGERNMGPPITLAQWYTCLDSQQSHGKGLTDKVFHPDRAQSTLQTSGKRFLLVQGCWDSSPSKTLGLSLTNFLSFPGKLQQFHVIPGDVFHILQHIVLLVTLRKVWSSATAS